MIRRNYPEYDGRPWMIDACRVITGAERRRLAPDAPDAAQYAYPSWVDLEFEAEAHSPPEPGQGHDPGR